MKALASDPAKPGAVLWAVLLGAFSLTSLALAGLTLRLHRMKRSGPRQVCLLLLLSFLLRTAWLAWYYGWDTDDNGSSSQHRSPLLTLEAMSRLNLNLTFTAVSSLLTLWLRALSADPQQKARIKRVHRAFNILLYAGSLTLELLGLLGGNGELAFFSTLWTSGMALAYLLGAVGFGLHLARGQPGAGAGSRRAHGLDLYRYIRKYTRRLQSFTLLVSATYSLFLALFLVGMLGNGRQGTNEVTPQSLPLHEAALTVELLLALLVIYGVRQPLSAGPPPPASADGGKGGGPKGATLLWSTSPRRGGDGKKKESEKDDPLRTPLLGGGGGGEGNRSPRGGGGVAQVVGGSSGGSRK